MIDCCYWFGVCSLLSSSLRFSALLYTNPPHILLAEIIGIRIPVTVYLIIGFFRSIYNSYYNNELWVHFIIVTKPSPLHECSIWIAHNNKFVLFLCCQKRRQVLFIFEYWRRLSELLLFCYTLVFLADIHIIYIIMLCTFKSVKQISYYTILGW